MFGGCVLSYLSWQQDKTYPGVAKFGIALEWGSRGRWFESSHSDHVGASCVSLAPTFFKSQSALTPLLLLSKSQPLTLGCDLGPPLCGGFVPLRGNINFNRPFHVGAKSALLLLSNCDPLRWARSWCAALRATSQYQRLLTNPPAVQEEKFTILQKELHSILGNSTT